MINKSRLFKAAAVSATLILPMNAANAMQCVIPTEADASIEEMVARSDTQGLSGLISSEATDIEAKELLSSKLLASDAQAVMDSIDGVKIENALIGDATAASLEADLDQMASTLDTLAEESVIDKEIAESLSEGALLKSEAELFAEDAIGESIMKFLSGVGEVMDVLMAAHIAKSIYDKITRGTTKSWNEMLKERKIKSEIRKHVAMLMGQLYAVRANIQMLGADTFEPLGGKKSQVPDKWKEYYSMIAAVGVPREAANMLTKDELMANILKFSYLHFVKDEIEARHRQKALDSHRHVANVHDIPGVDRRLLTPEIINQHLNRFLNDMQLDQDQHKNNLGDSFARDFFHNMPETQKLSNDLNKKFMRKASHALKMIDSSMDIKTRKFIGLSIKNYCKPMDDALMKAFLNKAHSSYSYQESVKCFHNTIKNLGYGDKSEYIDDYSNYIDTRIKFLKGLSHAYHAPLTVKKRKEVLVKYKKALAESIVYRFWLATYVTQLRHLLDLRHRAYRVQSKVNPYNPFFSQVTAGHLLNMIYRIPYDKWLGYDLLYQWVKDSDPNSKERKQYAKQALKIKTPTENGIGLMYNRYYNDGNDLKLTNDLNHQTAGLTTSKFIQAWKKRGYRLPSQKEVKKLPKFAVWVKYVETLLASEKYSYESLKIGDKLKKEGQKVFENSTGLPGWKGLKAKFADKTRSLEALNQMLDRKTVLSDRYGQKSSDDFAACLNDPLWKSDLKKSPQSVGKIIAIEKKCLKPFSMIHAKRDYPFVSYNRVVVKDFMQSAFRHFKMQELFADMKPIVGGVFRDALQDGGQGPQMVVLPSGNFRMGDLNGGGYSDEKPVHAVTINYSIAMSRHEVTFADYDRFARATKRALPDDWGWGRGTRPVILVSWKDAKAYAAWLSKQTGKRYRLPTEAEWEYAARAGTGTKYSWGNSAGKNQANCKDCGSRWDNKKTAPVGSFAGNAFGLYDMHGNVWEWVEDCHITGYASAPANGSARTTKCDKGTYRVCRGGSLLDSHARIRSSSRDDALHTYASRGGGFRLVQDFPTSAVRLLAPDGVKVTFGGTGATVAWNLVSDDTTYNLYYARESFTRLNGRLDNYKTLKGGARVSGINVTSHKLNWLHHDGSKYYFVVTANKMGIESVASSEVSGAPLGIEFSDALKSGGKGPIMIPLPTGSFRMGDLNGDKLDLAQPAHTVNINHLIAMSKYEVTFADYDRFARAGRRTLPDDEGWGRSTRPVINVSWQDAKDYAAWLSKQTGATYRLPSEAEWEYAARAGTSTKYSWGNDIGQNRANCKGCGSRWDNQKTAPAGSFSIVNAFGLHDMHGNVSEWVEDCFALGYTDAPTDGSARTTGCTRDNFMKVLRGGSAFSTPQAARSAYRNTNWYPNTSKRIGFRLVKELNFNSFHVKPAAPAGLKVTADNGQALITWQAVANASTYNLYYAQESFTGLRNPPSGYNVLQGGTLTPNLTDTSYTITGLGNRTKYYFVVTAANAAGEGRASLEKSATPQASEVGAVFRDALKDGGQGPEMVVIIMPAGSFRMGDLNGNGNDSAKPVRTVTFSRSIAINKHEVTFDDYDRFARATNRTLPGDENWGRGTRPVINVSRSDAKAYAAWLSRQTGKTYRLPSEAEWEYAARAGTTTNYSWGDEIGINQANCVGCGNNNWADRTAPVGRFAANAFGLYDMHGNVAEWVEDCYSNNYTDAPSDGSARTTDCDSTAGRIQATVGLPDIPSNPSTWVGDWSPNLESDTGATASDSDTGATASGSNTGATAIVRGGSWSTGSEFLIASYRFRVRPSTRSNDNGFRLVQDIDP